MKIKIGTHNGVFHADDVLAVAALKIVHTDAEVIRTRDEGKLAECDVVLDVGAKYDPEVKRYDHHQKGRAGARENGVLFSSLGLVWKHHGSEICGGDAEVARIVDETVVQPVDMLDNGQKAYEGEEAVKGVLPYNLSNAISAFNPNWNEKGDFDGAFARAVEFAQVVLVREIESAKGTVAAKGLARKAVSAAIDPRLIILEQFCPWHEVIIPEAPEALFVAFPSETGDWRLQSVPPSLGSFDKRKALPAAWAGKRGKDLAEITKVDDAIFCHDGLFICGAKSKEGVLEFARQALEA